MPRGKTREHRWEPAGLDLGAWCQDCRRPCNALQHLTRANHHVYVCCDCAAVRLLALPLRLREEG